MTLKFKCLLSFLGHLSYLQMPKIKDSHAIFGDIVAKSPQFKERQNLHVFELKWLICMYVEKLSPFSLFALCASDNLVHILLQLRTFHSHCANHKN